MIGATLMAAILAFTWILGRAPQAQLGQGLAQNLGTAEDPKPSHDWCRAGAVARTSGGLSPE